MLEGEGRRAPTRKNTHPSPPEPVAETSAMGVRLPRHRSWSTEHLLEEQRGADGHKEEDGLTWGDGGASADWSAEGERSGVGSAGDPSGDGGPVPPFPTAKHVHGTLLSSDPRSLPGIAAQRLAPAAAQGNGELPREEAGQSSAEGGGVAWLRPSSPSTGKMWSGDARWRQRSSALAGGSPRREVAWSSDGWR